MSFRCCSFVVCPRPRPTLALGFVSALSACPKGRCLPVRTAAASLTGGACRGVTYNCDIVDGAVRGLIPLRTQIGLLSQFLIAAFHPHMKPAGFMPYGNFLYDPSLIYLTSDVERVSAELSSYKIAIEQKQPGAEQNLEDYKTSMKASIAVIDEVGLQRWGVLATDIQHTTACPAMRGLGR